MFGMLKKKLKSALEKITKRIEQQSPDGLEKDAIARKQKKERKKKIPQAPREEETAKPKIQQQEHLQQEERGFFSRLRKKKKVPEQEREETPEGEGFFKKIVKKITTTSISVDHFDELFSPLEMALLENSVALTVVDTIKDTLKGDLVGVALPRGRVLDTVKQSLQRSIEGLFSAEPIDLVESLRKKKEKPFVIVFVGVNGSGKTTTIAKVAHLLKKKGFSCLLVAGDTWRAASIQQLEEHGRNLDVRVIKHDYGSDPAAVAFDGIKAAQAKQIDAVLIDTAGRQHSNKNLMDEMKKIIRIAKPDLKIFVGESIVGNDAVDQAEQFNAAVGLDCIILTKADVDDKGGAAVSISHVIGKPILYLGIGQHYSDLASFTPGTILKGLGLS